MRASTTSMRRSVFAMLAVLSISAVVMIEEMNRPEPANACGPACIAIAGIGVRQLIVSGLTAGAAVGAAHHLAQKIDRAKSRAREKVGSGRYRKLVRAYRHNGKAVWSHVGRKLGNLARWVKRHTTRRQLRRRGPGAAWACLVAGFTSLLMNGDVEDAAYSCLGAGIVTLFSRGKGKVGHPLPPAVAVRP